MATAKNNKRKAEDDSTSPKKKQNPEWEERLSHVKEGLEELVKTLMTAPGGMQVDYGYSRFLHPSYFITRDKTGPSWNSSDYVIDLHNDKLERISGYLSMTSSNTKDRFEEVFLFFCDNIVAD